MERIKRNFRIFLLLSILFFFVSLQIDWLMLTLKVIEKKNWPFNFNWKKSIDNRKFELMQSCGLVSSLVPW